MLGLMLRSAEGASRSIAAAGAIYPVKSVITATPGGAGPSKARSSAVAADRGTRRAIMGDRSTRPAAIKSSRLG